MLPKKSFIKLVNFLGNKTVDAVTKSNNNKIVKPDENPRNVGEIFIPSEKIIIPSEKRDEVLYKLRKVL